MADVPGIPEAEALLIWAEQQNPGLWVNHVRTAGRAARTIAAHCGMDGDRCYVLGLLHDIGRYEGKNALRHVIAGYDLMMSKGFVKAAEVCLTHSFPLADIAAFSGQNDCTEEETARISRLLQETFYCDEIRLIQLCDAISLPQGVTLMEKRLFDVGMRHSFVGITGRKWQEFFHIKAMFDQKCGVNIYQLFREEIVSGLFSF